MNVPRQAQVVAQERYEAAGDANENRDEPNAIGLAALLAGGSMPGLGTSPAKLAAYFAANSSAHKVDVVLSVLIAVPLTV